MVRSFPGVVERLADGLQLLRIEGRTFGSEKPPVWLGEFRVICLAWHPRLPITNHCTKPCVYPLADISTLTLGHGRNVGTLKPRGLDVTCADPGAERVGRRVERSRTQTRSRRGEDRATQSGHESQGRSFVEAGSAGSAQGTVFWVYGILMKAGDDNTSYGTS